MSQIKTLNGVQYTLPGYSDTGWGADTGNVLTQYMAAIADVTLQLTGGSFTLTADANFGATFGLVSTYFKSRTANIASAGQIRLASADTIKFRNNANGADIAISKDASDNLQWNATKILLSGAVVNADINAAAAIAYSKLNLAGSIVNADVNASAAIAYSKLNLAVSIVNADVAVGAAIVYSKLNLATSIVNADVSGSAAIAYSKLNLATSIVNADIGAAAAIAYSKLAALTSAHILVGSAGNVATDTAVTGDITISNGGVTTLAGTITGTHTFSGQLIGKGTATNDSAAAGIIGERVSSAAAATNAAATGTYKDLTSISLTAGDWDISFSCISIRNSATHSGVSSIGISTTTGNSATGLVEGDNLFYIPGDNTVNADCATIANYQASIAGTTTYYAKINAQFSAGTPQFAGRLTARRVR